MLCMLSLGPMHFYRVRRASDKTPAAVKNPRACAAGADIYGAYEHAHQRAFLGASGAAESIARRIMEVSIMLT